MALTDIRHDTDVRFRHLTETVHLAKSVDAHLKDCDLIILLNTEDGQRQTDFIIIVAGSLMYLVLL